MSALGQMQTLKLLRLMSALPPKADIAERDWHVRFVPKADKVRCSERGPLLDHVVGSVQQAKWHAKTQRLGCVEVDDESDQE